MSVAEFSSSRLPSRSAVCPAAPNRTDPPGSTATGPLNTAPPVYHSAGHRHLHVACATCGEVVSVDPGVLDSAAERLLDEIGFTVDVGHVALSGTCRACRRTAKAEGSEGGA